MPFVPNDVLLFSDAQYPAGRGRMTDPIRGAISCRPHSIRSAEIEWSPVWSLRDQRFKYLPTSLLYFFYQGPGQINADSNGCAAGNTLAEAIVQGFLELVERDAYAIWWYNRLQRPQVDLGQFDDSYIRDLQAQLAETGRRLWVLDITSDLGIPSFVAIAHWMNDWTGKYRIRFRRAFRSAHRLAARADRAEPVPVHRSHGRRDRRQIEPRRHHSVAPAGPSLS